MIKVFFEDFVIFKDGSNKNKVDWNSCVGKKIRYIYEDIESHITVVDVKDYNKIDIMDEFGEAYTVYKRYVRKGMFSKIANKINKIKYADKNITAENNVNKFINESHPHIIQYIVNYNDECTYTKSSNKLVNVKCPMCGYEFSISVKSLCSRKYPCDMCSDGVSYPEKFVMSYLTQLGISFTYNSRLDWSMGKIYDFILLDTSEIIEVHGLQHYEKSFSCSDARTLSFEIDNDNFKAEIATKNGYRYIEIDARYSTVEHIKNSLIKEFGVKNVDYDKCDKDAMNSKIVEAIKIYNGGIKSAEKISKSMGMGQSTISGYLKIGDRLGMCDYKPSAKKYIEIYKDGELINTILSLCGVVEYIMLEYGIKTDLNRISSVCRGRKNSHKGFVFKHAATTSVTPITL